MGMTALGVFSCKIWKKNIREHSVFERYDVFLTKYGHESSVFLDNGQNMGMRLVTF